MEKNKNRRNSNPIVSASVLDSFIMPTDYPHSLSSMHRQVSAISTVRFELQCLHIWLYLYGGFILISLFAHEFNFENLFTLFAFIYENSRIFRCIYCSYPLLSVSLYSIFFYSPTWVFLAIL